MFFTDFFYKEMFTCLISFSSRNTFSLEFLLFFTPNRIGSERSHKIPNLSLPQKMSQLAPSTLFTHFDGLCNYLDSFQKQLAANFFNNNCCFPFQGHFCHYTNKFTETGLDFFIKYLLGPI